MVSSLESQETRAGDNPISKFCLENINYSYLLNCTLPQKTTPGGHFLCFHFSLNKYSINSLISIKYVINTALEHSECHQFKVFPKNKQISNFGSKKPLNLKF
jgi:hypothetical protein